MWRLRAAGEVQAVDALEIYGRVMGSSRETEAPARGPVYSRNLVLLLENNHISCVRQARSH